MKKFSALSLIAAFMFSMLTSNLLHASGTLYLNQDFDNPSFPPQGWSVNNTSGYNIIRTSYCSGYGAGAASAVVDFYDYASGSFDLLTPNFPVSTSGDSLIFDHAYAPATNESDRLDIFTSTDNGTTWVMLISLAGGSAGPLRTAPATFDLFVPNSSQWATKKYSLPSGTNKIKFSAVSSFGNNLYLDNIRIGFPYNTDVAVTAIPEPKWGIAMNEPAPVPKIAVTNYGNTAQSFHVTMVVTPTGFTDTKSVTNLAPGQTQTLTMNSNTFLNAGNYTLKAYTDLAGDLNRSNDTVTNNLVVTTALRNVVLEFSTGTWCQWCPCGEAEVMNLHNTYPESVILAYHGANSDPWKTFPGNNIISLLGFGGYPSGLVDRRLGNNNGWGSFFTDGEYRLSSSPAASIEINNLNTTYNPATRQLSINLNANPMTDLNGVYKVNYVITEDNLIYPQTGNSSCPGSSTWEHDWIVRSIVNTVSGDVIHSGAWTNHTPVPMTFTTTLDTGWVAVNCKLNVIVFKDNGVLSTSEVQQGLTLPIVTTGIDPVTSTFIPAKYELSQNFPNPFNPTTNITFSIPKDGSASLKIYNVLGELMEVYLDGFIRSGTYNAQINASNYPSGIYFYTLTAKDFTDTKKMNLIK